jgi:hypothetical protein
MRRIRSSTRTLFPSKAQSSRRSWLTKYILRKIGRNKNVVHKGSDQSFQDDAATFATDTGRRATNQTVHRLVHPDLDAKRNDASSTNYTRKKSCRSDSTCILCPVCDDDPSLLAELPTVRIRTKSLTARLTRPNASKYNRTTTHRYEPHRKAPRSLAGASAACID